VVLLSGATVCTYCPAWRQECLDRQNEATMVLGFRDRDARRAHLAKCEARFGAEYRKRLEAVILSTWERRRAAASGASNA